MQIFIKGKIKKKKKQHTYTRGEQCVNRLLRSPNCDGSAVQSFPKAIEQPFITQGYQTSYSHDVCFYTLSWHGMVTCVESIPKFAISIFLPSSSKSTGEYYPFLLPYNLKIDVSD